MTVAALTDAEINHYRETYDRLTKGHGMTADTLKEIYKLAKINASDSEINAQFQAADSKGHGKLDFEDFLNVMTKQNEKNPEEGITKVWEELDTDKDGLITGEDLKRGIAMYGNSVTENDIDEMLASADVDGDGMINYEEFLKVMTPSKVNGQTQF